jgi:4-amino-4-deoxy-L-arabinose transferase-like glycosyltransferase
VSAPNQNGRRPWLGPISILVLSLGVRLAWLLAGPKVIESEGVYYARVGENLAAGRGLVGIHEMGLQLLYPPLYSSLIAVGVWLGLSAELAGRTISLLAGTALPVVCYLLAKKLYGAAAGWCAGLLAALHPLLISVSAAVLTESLYLTLATVAVYFMVGALGPGARRPVIAAGIALGLAYVCRPEGFILALLFAATIVVVNRRALKSGLARAALLLSVFSIFAVPYIGFLWRETGRPRFEAKTADGVRWALREEAGQTWGEIYYSIDRNLNDTGASNTSDLDMLLNTRASLPTRARLIAKQAVRNFPKLLRALGGLQLGAPFIAMLAALGLFGAAWDRDRWMRELPVLLPASLTLATFCTWPFFHDRFLYPILPSVLIWSGAGLARVWTSLDGTATALRLRRLVAGGIVTAGAATFVLLVCASAAVGVKSSDELSNAWEPVLRDDVPMGRWLKTQGERVRLMDTEPTVAFYSGAVLVPFPWTDSETALRYLDRKQIAFLVLRDTDRERRPYIGEWLKRVPDPRLELVKTFSGTTGVSRIYRWRGAVGVGVRSN